MEWNRNNIFLNKGMIIDWNIKKTSVKIHSPFNDGTSVWFLKGAVNRIKSKDPNYFSILIYRDQLYRVYRYKGFTQEGCYEIRGEKLMQAYEEMKNNNSQAFLKKQKALSDGTFGVGTLEGALWITTEEDKELTENNIPWD